MTGRNRSRRDRGRAGGDTAAGAASATVAAVRAPDNDGINGPGRAGIGRP